MHVRFFRTYSETEILEREYSIKGRLHVDPSNWDFRTLIFDSQHLAEDVKKEKQELDRILRGRGSGPG